MNHAWEKKMAKVGVITNKGLDEIVLESERPKLLFGLGILPLQKKERRSIGFALINTGLEVYATSQPWPNDSYITNNGLVLPEMHFGKLAHGGNYVFGEDFVLVSADIKENLEQMLKGSAHFRQFFDGKDIIFVPPYNEVILHAGGTRRHTHIDRTIGYIPGLRLLSADIKHYQQEKKLFDDLKEKYKAQLLVTSHDSGGHNLYEEWPDDEYYREKVQQYGSGTVLTGHDVHLPNNYYTIILDGKTIVIANKYNNPFHSLSHPKVEVIETGSDITLLPVSFHGSVKCTVNASFTTKLWDHLGIDYRKWGVDPRTITPDRRSA